MIYSIFQRHTSHQTHWSSEKNLYNEGKQGGNKMGAKISLCTVFFKKINQKTPTRSWSEWCSESSDTTADLLRRFPAQLLLTLSDDGLQVWTSVQVLRCHASEQFPQFQTNLLTGFSIVFRGIEQGHPKGKQVGLSRNQRKLETRGKHL